MDLDEWGIRLGKFADGSAAPPIVRAGAVLALLCLTGACAATREPPPPPVTPELSPPGVDEPAVVPETTKEDYSLPDVSGEPGIAPFTEQLAGAEESGRPAALLARATASIREAQIFRRRHIRALNVFDFGDELHFVAYYELAGGDCREILERFPGSPQAPEAQFTLGLVNDYPHLTRFEEADEAYLVTMDNFPGTEAARKAEVRLRRLRKFLGVPMPPPVMQDP